MKLIISLELIKIDCGGKYYGKEIIPRKKFKI